MEEPVLTQDIVRRLLRYNRKTGRFVWRSRKDVRKAWNTRYAGKEAGSAWTPDGGKNYYRVLRIFDYPFMAHRIAVLYVTGQWPPDDVDHRDRNGLNNRWANLRLATKSQNGLNRGVSRRSTTGVKGVFQDRGGRFRTALRVNGILHAIGSFPTIDEAAAAYRAKVEELAGEFGAVK